MPHYSRDPRRDPNFDNHPHVNCNPGPTTRPVLAQVRQSDAKVPAGVGIERYIRAVFLGATLVL